MKPFRLSLTFAILASLALLLLLTWFLVSLISFKTAENDLLSQKNEEGRILLASFINLLPSGLSPVTAVSPAGRFAGRLSAEKSFAGITLVDDRAKIIYSLGDMNGPDARLHAVLKGGGESWMISGTDRIVSRYAPVLSEGRVVGAARLSLSLRSEYDRLNRSQHIFLLYFVLDCLLLLAFGSYMLSRFIVVPIRKLLSATERIAAGDLNHSVSAPGGAEIADLAEAFNKMVTALRKKRDDIDRHVKSLEAINSELKTARHEAMRSEKMASIGLLAAGTAHEIGTPLAAIMGYAGILREEFRNDPEKADYLGRIEAESERIDRIVRSLLDYARPTRTTQENADVAEVISITLRMLTEQGVFKKISTYVEVMDGPAPVSADRHQLQQVLTNLLINARDAMPHGGTVGIKVGMDDCRVNPGGTLSAVSGAAMGRRRDDFHGVFMTPFPAGIRLVKIEISDNGEGIEPENLERIFDPFFTTKEPGHGTGLGLSISARIIDSFGGRITVDSEKGKGSRFTIWLPEAN